MFSGQIGHEDVYQHHHSGRVNLVHHQFHQHLLVEGGGALRAGGGFRNAYQQLHTEGQHHVSQD